MPAKQKEIGEMRERERERERRRKCQRKDAEKK